MASITNHPQVFAPQEAHQQHGFTLIEIMVVVVIIGVLAALVAPNLVGEAGRAKIVKVQHDIRQIESALARYQLDNSRMPTTDQGLQALVTKPSGGPELRNYKPGGYLAKLPKDPWGNPYHYLQPGQHGPVDIFSLGADNASGGEDQDKDIGNWEVENEN